MNLPIVSTKLNVPPVRARSVLRPRLMERMHAGADRKLTLVSASAGFGKTTLVSAWLADCERPAAWLSLDDKDNEPTRFLSYLVAALQSIAPRLGEGVLGVLSLPQTPPAEAILTSVLRDIAELPLSFALVLDDYHVVKDETIHQAIAFLLERLPRNMRLVIATREDPPLPLARLRVRNDLTEIRGDDLRFTLAEAAAFLNDVMGLRLAAGEIEALESRTEGWIAGLQLAALSMHGQDDASAFIASFAGSDRYIIDYLVEEVFLRQPEEIQQFLLSTSILERMCGPLCDALLPQAALSGQEALEQLERANLFVVPLDRERRWYRYHHLFGELLRERRQRTSGSSPANREDAGTAALHARASQWYEEHGLELEALRHAAAARDVERAARLVEGRGMPLHFRGAAGPVLQWLESLPAAALDARPALWVIYASALLATGRLAEMERKLQAAEAAVDRMPPDAERSDLTGHIAAIRATLAVSRHDAQTIVEQSRRALAAIRPDNAPVRTSVVWALGYAHHLQGERAAAEQAYRQAFAMSEGIGHWVMAVSSAIGIGNMQEADNRLYEAADTYRSVLQRAGDPPLPVACEAHLGLARLFYAWNELEEAAAQAEKGLALAQVFENADRAAAGACLLARIRLAQGDASAAAALAETALWSARRNGFEYLLPEAAAAHALCLLRQSRLEEAARLAEAHRLPLLQARVSLLRGDAESAKKALAATRTERNAKAWAEERLHVMTLEVVAHDMRGERTQAMRRLREALALAEPGGSMRRFVDEGDRLARLLPEAVSQGVSPRYAEKLLAAVAAEQRSADAGAETDAGRPASSVQPLVEPLSPREIHILRLIAEGLSNEEIGRRLFLALSTVKGHNRNIYGKLQVRRRTEAVARARELGLL